MKSLSLMNLNSIYEAKTELMNSVYFPCTLGLGKEYGFTRNFSDIGHSPGILAAKRM